MRHCERPVPCFRKNIESFKLRADPGCMTIALLGRTAPFLHRTLDNTDGVVRKQKFYEVPRRLDNKTAKVLVNVFCPDEEA